MTILITGATGLIGTALTSQLLDQGHTVHFLTTRKENIITTPNHKGFIGIQQIMYIDLHAFKDVSCVVNLVGATIAKRWTTAYKEMIISCRYKPTTYFTNH